MIQIRDERAADVAAREHLLDACFGEARFTKTCERLREGRLPAEGLALVSSSTADWSPPCGCGTSMPGARPP